MNSSVDPGTVLLVSILTSGVVSAILSGAISFFTSTSVEKVKYSLAIRQNKIQKLQQSHERLLALDRESSLSFEEAKGDMDTALVLLVEALKKDFIYAEKVYNETRPILSQKARKRLNKALSLAEYFNSEASEAAAKRVFKEENIDSPMEKLKILVRARQEFIELLRKEVEDAYTNESKS